jgi:hypothetical protein
MAGEQKLFYPLFQQKEELCDLVNHAFKEHKEAKTLSPNWREWMRAIIIGLLNSRN